MTNIDLINKWQITNYDEKLRLEDNLDAFYKQFDDSNQELARKVMEHADYISEHKFSEDINKYIENAKEKFLIIFEDKVVKLDNTLLLVLDKKEIGNSDIFASRLGNSLGHHLLLKTSTSEEKILESKNLMIFDDYCGSGNSFLTYMNNLSTKLLEQNEKKEITYYPLYITKEALSRIKKVSYKNIKIDIQYCENQIRDAKVISNKTLIDDDIYLKEFKKLCVDTLKIKYFLGLYDIEDNICFFYYVPNDTIGFYYENTKFYNPPFKRYVNVISKNYFNKNSRKIVRDNVFKHKTKIAQEDYWIVYYLMNKTDKQIMKELGLCSSEEYSIIKSKAKEKYFIKEKELNDAIISDNINMIKLGKLKDEMRS